MHFGGGHVARDNHFSATASFSRTVAFDRRLLTVTLFAGLLLLWPMLVYGRPGYIPDSAAYYKGGRTAVAFVLDKIEKPAAAPLAMQPGANPPGTPGQRATDAKSEVRGARSVAYSLAAFVLGAPNAQMWALAAMQALATGFVCAVTLLLFAGGTRVPWWKPPVLAVATPVAFVSCLVIPDVFAGLVIMLITLFATTYRGLSPGVKAVGVLIAASGIAFHASHLPLGFGLTVVALAWMALRARRKMSIPRGQWALVSAPFLLGAAATVVLNFAAFGGPSLTGKRYPLTLARSVAEGPGKWYLEQNCGHLHYAVCELYPHGHVPGTINDFLWGPNGVKQRATAGQMDRIRAEEPDVVVAAARAYPVYELRWAASNFARQLVLFSPGMGFQERIVLDATGTPFLEPAPYDDTWVRIVHLLSIASLIAALVVLYRRVWSDSPMRLTIGLVVIGIVLNDAICVYFSGVTDRYEARVIWLVPLLALAMLARNARRGGAAPDASPA